MSGGLRRAAGGGALSVVLSNAFSPFVGFASSFMAARYLAPTELGTLQGVLLIPAYISFLHFGIYNGTARVLPVLLSDGEQHRCRRLVSVSLLVAILHSAIGVGLAGGYLVLMHPFGADARVFALSAVLLVGTLAISPFVQHFDSTYRSSSDFKRLAGISFYTNGVYLLSSFLVVVFGLVGKVVSELMKLACSLFFRARSTVYTERPSADMAELCFLLKRGFPLLVGGYLWGLLTVADQSVIALHLGREQVGYYALSRMVTGFLIVIPVTVNQIFYARGSELLSCPERWLPRELYWSSLRSALLFTLPVAGITFFILPALAHFCFPAYSPGVRPAQINALACITYVFMGPSVIFTLQNRAHEYLLLVGAGVLAFWVFCLSFRDVLNSIEYIALAKLLVLTGVCAAVLWRTYVISGENNKHENC